MNEIRKRMVEALLEGEMTNYLGYEPHDPAGNGTGNSRNGYSAKKASGVSACFGRATCSLRLLPWVAAGLSPAGGFNLEALLFAAAQ
jgi:hypothetical protein